MSIGLVIFLFATWSSVFSLAKIALQYCPPVFLTSFRMLLGSVLILGFLGLARRRALYRNNLKNRNSEVKPTPSKTDSSSCFGIKLTKRQFLSLALLGFFSVYLTNILEFWGLQYLPAAKACLIYSFSPFFAAFFSYLHFKEKMNGKKWLGLGIGILGMMFPVIWMQSDSEEVLHAFSLFSWPFLAVMGAALCSVYGWVLLRVAVKDANISPLAANGVSMLFGGLMALMHSLIVDNWQPLPVSSHEWGSFFKITLVITCISNILCYNLYGMMLKRFTATFLSFMGLLSPIFASLHGWVFLGEPISWVVFVSTAILCFGLWIVYSAELKQGYIVKGSSLPTTATDVDL